MFPSSNTRDPSIFRSSRLIAAVRTKETYKFLLSIVRIYCPKSPSPASLPQSPAAAQKHNDTDYLIPEDKLFSASSYSSSEEDDDTTAKQRKDKRKKDEKKKAKERADKERADKEMADKEKEEKERRKRDREQSSKSNSSRDSRSQPSSSNATRRYGDKDDGKDSRASRADKHGRGLKKR
ncbi:hypothetical protein B0T24DRAFT_592950 [Lasiosphaeria ovina]|uniref:Uncharacterized protein n=1 Tax=Lasiosphaeria ovina TaxID=92902 RepID=A0AAE0KJB6_9PEZI|nr:hypothetical protein B0T24DRAFT_592950 [Lasiosphaeria ovina]